MVDGLAPWHAQLNRLRTDLGIDLSSACNSLAEIDLDLEVFASVCNDSQHLRAVLNRCVHAVARTKDCHFQAYHKAMSVVDGIQMPDAKQALAGYFEAFGETGASAEEQVIMDISALYAKVVDDRMNGTMHVCRRSAANRSD